MTDVARLIEVLDRLVDGWCDRRAVRPLGVLLPAHLDFTDTADAWARLERALRATHALGTPEVLDGELAVLDEAIALADQALQTRRVAAT